MREQTAILLGPLERDNLKGPNRVSPRHLRTELDPVSETLCNIKTE
jgi:hypothetical protein